jgi:hypothetical protein
VLRELRSTSVGGLQPPTHENGPRYDLGPFVQGWENPHLKWCFPVFEKGTAADSAGFSGPPRCTFARFCDG